MPYELGTHSIEKLRGVHPSLIAVVKRAIKTSKQDFMVVDGLRTAEQQRILVMKGASKTMASQHLKQRDGFGHAVDLVPYINGAPRWEWEPIWNIAVAMDEASTELNVNLVWGAVWDKPLMKYGGSAAELKAEVEAYKKRHPGSDFLDGPHYQMAS